MLFTRIGTVVAWLTLVTAVGRFCTAIYIMNGIKDAEEAALWAARYFGTKNLNAVLDQAAGVAAFAIGLGILAEISRSVRQSR